MRGGSQKMKKITWASDASLCQVRLFLSEDSPSQVGSDVQDHLQAKRSWMPHPNGATPDDVLPPGFGGDNSASFVQIDVSDIPVIKWKRPLRFLLDINWQVVAGEESGEVKSENERGLKVLEAVYPHASAIPSNSWVTAEVENECQNNQQPPLIPVTPVEDEDAAPEAPFNVPASAQHPQQLSNAPPNEHTTSGMALNVDPGLVAAALTAITKGNEHGNMIDPDLLMKVLSNQNLLQNLVTNHPSPQIIPNSDPSLSASSSGSFYPQPNGANAGPPPAPVGPPPGTKDFNYYKNLIQQHGGERQEPGQQFGNRYNNQQIGANHDVSNNSKPRDLRHKIMKPCIFFNSPRGCRNGANCPYQHDASAQDRGNGIGEGPNAKRMKMGREISS